MNQENAMQIFSSDVRVRTADHMRNLHDLSRAAREAAEGKAISTAAFRKEAAALVADVARETLVSTGSKGTRRKTR